MGDRRSAWGPTCYSGRGGLIRSMASWSGGAIWGASDGHDLYCCSSDPPLFPPQETRRAEDRVEMDDLRDELQALHKVLGHVHQVWGEKNHRLKLLCSPFPGIKISFSSPLFSLPPSWLPAMRIATRSPFPPPLPPPLPPHLFRPAHH